MSSSDGALLCVPADRVHSRRPESLLVSSSITTAQATSPAHVVGATCEAERCLAARWGAVLFKNRGWLPVPLLLAPLLLPGHELSLLWLGGLVLIAIGEGIRLAGVAAAGTTTRRRSRQVQRLVTYGAFAWSRNPLYNGNFLVWMGFIVISGVLWFVPVAMLIFAIEYSLIVRYEEGVLESIFGDEYLAYKQRTPRWIPRPPGGADAAMPDEAAGGPGRHAWAESWMSERSTFLQYAALILVFALKHRLT